MLSRNCFVTFYQTFDILRKLGVGVWIRVFKKKKLLKITVFSSLILSLEVIDNELHK